MKDNKQREPIAIVGIGCRFPGEINGPESFWKFLLNEGDAIRDIPEDRFKIGAYYDPNPNKAGKLKAKKGGFVNDIDKFDAAFFNIFPNEAQRIDPQQRFLLEVSYEAMEDAGIPLEKISGTKTGVYMGVFMNDYWDIQASSIQRDHISPHVPMGVSLTAIANRLSYVFNLQGPSMTIDTACSSSLVCVHLACQSIWNGESDQALAGGVNLIIRPESSIMMSKGNFLSPDGYCKSFDSRANGYVRSEGAGVIVLKPLSKALEDGDTIYSLIRGSAVNSDGHTEEGFTVPSVDAQVTMLESAYKDAQVDPAKVVYVEAHGTGTPVGDPIETNAFGLVVGKNRELSQSCVIGSVKSNIGHLEAAAGIAGLIKLSLILKRRIIPANLHFQKPNPKIPFDKYKLRVPVKAEPIVQKGTIYGGVNSFGAGGTNAHIVMESFEPSSESGENKKQNQAYLFSVSGKTKEALKTQVEKFIPFLKETKLPLRDICFTSIVRRSSLDHKLTISVRTLDELIESLHAFLAEEARAVMTYSITEKKKTSKIGFVYSGQGPQWYAMGRELLQKSEVFKSVFDRIEAHFKKISGWSLQEEMMKTEEESRISDTRIAQPAIMAVQVGLTEVWKSWGIEADGFVGHSIGEVAAAYASGALSLEQAVEVIYHRSRGQNRATGKGKMLAVGLSHKEALNAIKGFEATVSIAAVNGPASVALAGDAEPLEIIDAQLQAKDIFTRYLKVNVPFHSHHMEPLKEELISSLEYLQPSKCVKPLYSTVSGKLENGDHLVSEYWYRNVRETVFFSDAVDAMIQDGYDTFIEIAPHPILSVGVNELFALRGVSNGLIVSSLRRGSDEEFTMQVALSQLFHRGVHVDWKKFFSVDARFVKLPSYAWSHQRYWFETQEHLEKRLGKTTNPFVLGKKKSAVDEYCEIWEIELNKSTHVFLDDHKVEGTIIFPGTGHLEVAMQVGKESLGATFSHLADIQLESALFLPEEGESPEVRLEITNDEGGYTICSRPRYSDEKSWLLHSRGRIVGGIPTIDTKVFPLEDCRKRITNSVSIPDFYLELKEGGLNYGETFRCVQKLWTGDNEVLGALSLPESLVFESSSFNFHPALLDACLHTLFAARKSTIDEKRGIYLPVSIKEYHCFSTPAKHVWVHIDVQEASPEYLRGNYTILDEDGNKVAQIVGLTCKYVEGSRSESKDELYKGMYEYQWKELEVQKVAKKTDLETVVVLADKSKHYLSVFNQLKQDVKNVIVLHQGESYNRVSEDEYVIIPEVQSEFDSVFKLISEKFGPIGKIVSFVPFDYTISSDTAFDLQKEQHRLNLITLSLLKSVASLPYEPGLVLFHQGTEKIVESDEIQIAHSSQLGFGRVLINEFPFIGMTMLNLSTTISSQDWELVEKVILAEQKNQNPELAIRNGSLFERNLVPVTKTDSDERFVKEVSGIRNPFKPVISETGILDSIQFREFKRKNPSADQVEIEVRAGGVNFKDVMNAMGLLTDEAVSGGVVGKKLGLECSGVISKVGSNVTNLKIGDEVMAWSSESFAGYTIADEKCVVKKPASLTFEQASSVPVTYLTAYYAMQYLGRISPGERVLIHSATGGVGMAAIQIARMQGAEIYATAGNEEKRKLLKSLGILNVYDSRTTDFADQILKDTQGKGVDFVLNSLSGKAISANIRCLAPFGRFVEIGKTDIYKDAKIALKRFGNNLSFHAVDLDRLMLQKPVLGNLLFNEVKELFDKKVFTVGRVNTYPIQQISDAITYLSKGVHVGKVVVSMNESPLKMYPSLQLELDPEASYLVTGGASGFGLELAYWLTQKGAKHLVLVSRSGCKSDYDKKLVSKMEASGVRVGLMNVDISKLSDVQKVMNAIQAEMPPLKGIIHSAAVLQDATLKNMDSERFDNVYDPKVMGAWNFHLATQHLSLDFYLMLSSISSIFGLPGQSNYSSANNFLDKLALYRQHLGLKACSVNLGVLGLYAGMSKEGEQVLKVLANQGWNPLSLKQVTDKIENILLQQPSSRMAANLDWKKFKDFFSHLQSDKRFAEIIQAESGSKGAGKSGSSLSDQVLQLQGEEQAVFLQEKIVAALAKILGTSVDRIDVAVSISKIGLDSLMLNQLRNWIQQKLEINFPLMKIAKGPSIVELSSQLISELNKAGEGVTNDDTTGITTSEDVEIVNEWLVRPKNSVGKNPQMRIFCIHPVGAGASMFSHFMFNAPAEAEILAFQLPGRENRSHEANLEQVSVAVEQMANAMLPLLDKPFVIMGHSFGGILGFELIKYLKAKHQISPSTFVVSGTIAPQLTKKWKERDVISQTAVFTNSEERLLALMTYIDDVEFLKKILPVMRKDMPIIMNYQYVAGEKLSVPIVAYAADKDEVVTAEEVSKWVEQTEVGFDLEVVPGDHWFLSRNRDQILARLTDVIKETTLS